MGAKHLCDATFKEPNQMELEKPELGTDGTTGRSAQIGDEISGADTGSTGMTPKALLVCFSGKIGSGKTSTSMAVAEALGCGHTSFSSYLRDVIAALGGDLDCRESLQDLGQCRIEQDVDLFCREVLAAGGFVPGKDFVLDGVRHVEVPPHLVRIAAPSEMRLIFLKADAGLRSTRAGERSAKEARDFNRAENHVVEADMEKELPSAAHAIVDGSLSEPAVIQRCIELIDNWRQVGADNAPIPVVRAAAVRAQSA